MPAPLSDDLRRRIIDAWRKKKLTNDELAEQFGVGSATVKRLKRTYRETKDVRPKPHGGGTTPIIGKEQEPLVEALVQRHPDWTEDRFAKALAEEHAVEASAVTVGRAIRRLGYSVKKKRSSRKNATAQTSASGVGPISSGSETSPLRVWFLWTKPARTSR
jgi:transposase